MQEVLKISQNKIGGNFVNSISARELHKKLGSKDAFTHWIKNQINKSGLEENIDFVKFWSDGGKPIATNISENELLQIFKSIQQATALGWESDYVLTIESAKHISMISGTTKGKEIRNYFISVENSFKVQISQSQKRENLISVSKEELDKELQALKFILDNCNLSESEKIKKSNDVFKNINFIVKLDNSHLKKNEPVFTLTQLLKDFQVPILTRKFNLKLETFGIIEQFDNGWILIEMKFGENRKFQDGTNPKYYKSTFLELLDIVL